MRQESLCCICWARTHGYTPDMGDELAFSHPGKCAGCGATNRVVFDHQDDVRSCDCEQVTV